MECSLCNQIKQPTKEQKYPCVPCDSCRRPICMDCSELTSSEIKCLPLQKRLLIFHCRNCRNYKLVDILQNAMNDKDQIINEKNEIIKMLKDKLEEYETSKINEIPQLSYADAAKQKRENTTVKEPNYPSLIIKPKIIHDGKQTREDINLNIDISELKIGVKELKISKSGTAIIKCQTKEETDLLETAAINKLQDKYNIQLTKMRIPRIKIVNFNQQMEKDQIEKYIKQQNLVNGDITVTHIRHKRGSTLKTIFCECSATAFHNIMTVKRICIGWERYTAYEDLEIPRCFHCQGFFHKKQDCRNKLVCPLCSDEHEENACPKRKKCCNNCLISNEKYKTKYSTDHFATDFNCPVLKYHQTVLKNKTNYN